MLRSGHVATLWASGRRLELVQGGKDELETSRVPRHAAERLLADVMRSEDGAATLRRTYARLAGWQHGVAELPAAVVVQWFIRHLHGSQAGGRFYLIDSASGTGASTGAATADSETSRALDAALTALGRDDIAHRGSLFRLVRAGGRARGVNREVFEVLSDREARQLLPEIVADAGLREATRAALAQLIELTTADPNAFAAQLLLLRRFRRYARPEEQPAVTPSKLRSKELHFIAIEAVTEAEEPVVGIELQVVCADGSTRAVQTGEDGMARVEPVPPGSATVRVLNRDGKQWRAAGARPAAQQPAARKHRVKQGECLSKIAHQYGLADWGPIWDHADNAALRQKRKSAHVLLPGDEVAVPALSIHELERPVDAVHRITVKPVEATVELSVQFRDEHGEALKDEPFELRWGKDEEPRVSGKLDGAGKLVQKVPVSIPEVELLLCERRERYKLLTSRLDPTESEPGVYVPTGVGWRLWALGYLHRLPERASPADQRDAITAFQREAMGQAEPAGELDAATCQKLEELYGA